jgi:hypothetical protein
MAQPEHGRENTRVMHDLASLFDVDTPLLNDDRIQANGVTMKNIRVCGRRRFFRDGPPRAPGTSSNTIFRLLEARLLEAVTGD